MMVYKARKKPVVVNAYRTDTELDIQTLEGVMHAEPGGPGLDDFLHRGAHLQKRP